MRHGIISLFFILFFGMIHAQKQFFKTYTVKDGLANNFVRFIYQDKIGYIWIATEEGMSKYDGHKFSNYTKGSNLSFDVINDLLESENGDIYMACNDGSLCLIEDNAVLKNVIQKNIIINRFRRIGKDKILVTTDFNGLQEFKNGKLIKPIQPYPNRTYYDVTYLNDSLMVVRGDSTLDILTSKYELFSEHKELALINNTCLFTDSKKRTWIGTASGLKLLSTSQEKGKPLHFLELPGSFNIHLLQKHWIRNMHEDQEGNIWVGTVEGLVCIGVDGSRQVITEKSGLPSSDVTAIIQDREKNIWIGTTLGLARLVTKSKIQIYRKEDGIFSDNVVNTFTMNNGNILIESYSYSSSSWTVQIFDKTTSQFRFPFNIQDHYPYYNSTSNLCLIRNKKSTFGRLNFFQGFKDKNGFFFTNSTAGVLVSDDLIKWEPFFKYSDTRTILIDSKGYLWAGHIDSGLFRIRYDYVNNQLRMREQEWFLRGIGIRSILEDSRGNIWAGSRYDGIYQLDPNKKDNPVIHHFDRTNGLNSNRVVSITEDKTGSIWIITNQGLEKLIPDRESYRVFNFSRINDFSSLILSMTFDQDNSLWLGTTKGLVCISDGELEKSPPLNTFITAATLGDSSYVTVPRREIELKPKHKSVHFEFAAPGFINEKQIYYTYRLLGSNNTDWSKPTNVHSVSYASLQPGDYRFEVRTLGWNGEWGKAAGFDFSVTPPFWQTWWFITITALLVISGIYWVMRKRIAMIRREAQMKNKIAETEMMALRAQMNPHFIFNSLNSIENFIMQNEKRLASDYLNKFSKLIRGMLDSSLNDVIPLEKDMELLKLYMELEQLRFNNKFSTRIDIDPELLQGDFKVPSLLIQPYLENAIVHGIAHSERDDLVLMVKVMLRNNQIYYTIEDNGVGRHQAANYKKQNKPLHKSVGLKITADRVAHFNQEKMATGAVVITDLFNKENNPAGTRVWITIPAN